MKMNLRMTKEMKHVLVEKEQTVLRDEIFNLLEDYYYNPSNRAIDKILNTWNMNKGWMIELFKKHPNYNGKYQIVFDTDYERKIDTTEVKRFARYINDKTKYLLEEKIVGKFSYNEYVNITNRLQYICDYCAKIEIKGYKPSANGKSLKELFEEKEEWEKKLKINYTQNEDVHCDRFNNMAYDRVKYETRGKVNNVIDGLYDLKVSLADERFVKIINLNFPEVKAVVGQKVSRIINKLCGILGINKEEDYNREFAKFADAINPLKITRHTILSCHPIDYLTMSFGNSWASCHTIDKDNKRNMPDNYSGCYSSGTLSYMLDESSFVFYTVESKYNGNEYELQDKVNRNMFHIGEDKIVQARIYPQCNDGEDGLYKQFREIAQKVIAECLGVPNLWKNVKGVYECGNAIRSYGTHYRDYRNFSSCNVSYLKYDNTEDVNTNKIEVGHNPICPTCGYEHSYEECIECEDCWDGSARRTCNCCGSVDNEEDMYYIDGEWYCCDCTFYCEYHDAREVGGDDSIYVEDYGYVCEHAFSNGDFFICEHCDRTYHIDDCITTVDGNTYCCERHAMNDDYIKISNGEWYHIDDLHYCEDCENSVTDDEWNDEYECCEECASEREEDEEENDEE